MPTFSSLQKQWIRPSLIIFSEDEPQQGTGLDAGKWYFPGQTLYLTDDNRAPLQVSPLRIENKRRMIDGTMRSVWVNDKKEFSTSWTNIPSRKNAVDAYDNTEPIGTRTITSDGFGAGLDIRSWYEDYTGDFWMLLVYDVDDTKEISNAVEVYNVFMSSFDYTVAKRGQYNDLWDVSLSLVEV